jgi:hypothetical protein
MIFLVNAFYRRFPSLKTIQGQWFANRPYVCSNTHCCMTILKFYRATIHHRFSQLSGCFSVSLSASNYESLQTIVKSEYLLAVAKRLSLEFIFKALVGMLECCSFDFLQSQSVSTSMQHHNMDLLTAELAAKGSELPQLSALLLLS